VVIDLEKGTVEEGKTKMTISTPATQVTQGAVEYRLFSEAGKSIVESRDAKSKKTNWQVEVMPAGGAQAPQEMGGAAPMQPMPRAKLLPADAGELFANVQAVEFDNVEWRMGDEIMDPPQYGN
jgi:hypothetical protein